MNGLKPCPVCQSTDVVPDSRMAWPEDSQFRFPVYFVRCNSCGAIGPLGTLPPDGLWKWNNWDPTVSIGIKEPPYSE